MLADDPSPCYYGYNSITSLLLLLSFNSPLSTNHGGLMPHVQHEPVEDSVLSSYSRIHAIKSSVISTHVSKLISAEKQRAGWDGGGVSHRQSDALAWRWHTVPLFTTTDKSHGLSTCQGVELCNLHISDGRGCLTLGNTSSVHHSTKSQQVGNEDHGRSQMSGCWA